MDESEYERTVAKAFRQLLTALDEVDPDLVDVESTGDMVTITATAGEKCVVNTQRAVHQIWVAGKGQGIHFTYDPERHAWWDDKGKGLELFAFVGDAVEALCGFRLRPP